MQKLLRIVALFGLLLILSAGLFLAKPFFETALRQRSSIPIKESGQREQQTPKILRDKLGIREITIEPGGDYFPLADGISHIGFGRAGLPDVIFGDRYHLNDIHAVNYLPVREEIAFYSNGATISIKNLGCRKELRHSTSDVPGTFEAVVDCTLRITSELREPRFATLPPKQWTFSSDKEAERVLLDGAGVPFLAIQSPKLTIQNTILQQSRQNLSLKVAGMTSYSDTVFWDIFLITGYGLETIRFEPDDIWNKKSQQAMVGSLKVTIEISDLDCMKSHFQDREWQECTAIFEVMASQVGSSETPLFLFNYAL